MTPKSYITLWAVAFVVYWPLLYLTIRLAIRK